MAFILLSISFILSVSASARTTAQEFIVDGKKIVCQVGLTISDCTDAAGNQVPPPATSATPVKKKPTCDAIESIAQRSINPPPALICDRFTLADKKLRIPKPDEAFFRSTLPEHFKVVNSAKETPAYLRAVQEDSIQGLIDAVKKLDHFLDEVCSNQKELAKNMPTVSTTGSFSDLAKLAGAFEKKAKAYADFLGDGFYEFKKAHLEQGNEVRKRFFYNANHQPPKENESPFGNEFQRNWGRDPDVFQRRKELIKLEKRNYLRLSGDFEDIEDAAKECAESLK